MIITAHANILEGATVSLSANSQESTSPLYRLYDRNTGRMFRAAGAATTEISIDQGALSIQGAERMLIASGHNLAGAALALSHSDNGADYTQCASLVASAGVIDASWSAVAKRYWRLSITGPAEAPALAELFITSTSALMRTPLRSSGPFESEPNTITRRTSGGSRRALVMGPARRRRPYELRITEPERAALDALWAACAGGSPFWMRDHEGSWIFGYLASAPGIKEAAPGVYAADFNFTEALP